MQTKRLFLTPLIALIAFTCTGCSNTGPKAFERSLQEYHQGQWAISAMWAKKALDEERVNDEAKYMLGLCEFQMHHVDKAKSWFEQAATSSDEEVRGRASAMLGIIASNDGDYITAATAFEQATADLKGNDKAKASSRVAATRSGFSFSSSTGTGSYTLQFGAYQKIENAQAAAMLLGSDLRLAGIGNPLIVEEKNQVGKVLFMVRAGSFQSRGAASRCRKRHSLPQCIVTAVQ